MQHYKVIGICGRESAGKSTTANLIAGSSGGINYSYDTKSHILSYLVELWFVFDETNRDTIWNKSPFELESIIVKLFSKYLGNWQRSEYRVVLNFERECSAGWKIFGLADLLKVGCSSLLNLPLDILMGEEEDARKMREIIKTEKFDSTEIQRTFPTCDGALTGRQCLQYIASQIFKAHFDDAFWNKILNAKIKKQLQLGNRIVIPDARFHSDIHNVWNLSSLDIQTTMVMIFRSEADLLLSDEDRKTHPSCWEFLEILANNKDKPTIYLKNSGTIEDLRLKIRELFG